MHQNILEMKIGYVHIENFFERFGSIDTHNINSFLNPLPQFHLYNFFMFKSPERVKGREHISLRMLEKHFINVSKSKK